MFFEADMKNDGNLKNEDDFEFEWLKLNDFFTHIAFPNFFNFSGALSVTQNFQFVNSFQKFCECLIAKLDLNFNFNFN